MKRAAAIDLNVDFGESDNRSPSTAELEILQSASSINLSCGLHAGNICLLRAILKKAVTLHVAVGAHPSYDDREGFGRRETGLPAHAIEELVASQVTALIGLARESGARIRYVKAHGALYHRTASDSDAAAALCRAALWAGAHPLPLLGPAGSALEAAAKSTGLAFFTEGFLDRGYNADGTLVPRGRPGDMIGDPSAAASRAVEIALGEPIVAIDGSSLTIRAHSLCIHGDSTHALQQLRAVRASLHEAGVKVAPFAP